GPSPGKRAERPTATAVAGVATDSQGMGSGNLRPSGRHVPCPSAMHSRGEAVIGSAPASRRSVSRCDPVQMIGGMLNKTGIAFGIEFPESIGSGIDEEHREV